MVSALIGYLVSLALLFQVTSVRAVTDGGTLVDPNQNIAQNLEKLYKASIPILLWLVILMLIVAGYIYITSMGGQDRVKLAKEIVVSTLVGAALLLLLPLILEALGQ